MERVPALRAEEQFVISSHAGFRHVGTSELRGILWITNKRVLWGLTADNLIAKIAISRITGVKTVVDLHHHILILELAEKPPAHFLLNAEDCSRCATILQQAIESGSKQRSTNVTTVNDAEKPPPAAAVNRIVLYHRVTTASVTSPTTVTTEKSKPFVVFTVSSAIVPIIKKLQSDGSVSEIPDNTSVVTHKVLHRFSDFTQLHNDLSRHAPYIPLPSLPSKAWLQQFGKEFLDDRCAKLHDYMQALVAHPQLQTLPACRERLLQFLRDTTTHAIPTVAMPVGFFDTLLRTNTPQQDYEALHGIVAKWGLRPRRFVWNKYVVALFGVTSSGKSSLVNHLFTLPVTRSANAQVDTGYSFIETVPPEQFVKIANVQEFREFSEDELMRPLPVHDLDVVRDPRCGHVFYVGDAAMALHRYGNQFSEHSEQFKAHHQLRCVLVNERYLRGPPDAVALARRLLVVDTKGLDRKVPSELLDADDAALLSNQVTADVRVMQTFIRMADVALFLLPANEIHNCSEQLQVFELAVVSATQLNTREDFAERVVANKRQRDPSQKSLLQKWILDPSADLVAKLTSHLVATLGGRGRRIGDGDTTQESFGNARWEKIYFVVTKLDDVLRDATEGKSARVDVYQAGMQLFYELGRLLGCSLQYLEPPTFGHCYTIALPEKQRVRGISHAEPVVGDLEMLKAALRHRSSESSYTRRLDEAIVELSEQLEAESANQIALRTAVWWNSVSAMKKRALDRLTRQ